MRALEVAGRCFVKEKIMPSDVSIGGRIKKVRQDAGMGQQEFASSIGISANYLSEVESGKKEPSTPIILLIETRYAISEGWLLTGEGPVYKERAVPGEVREGQPDYSSPYDRALMKDVIEAVDEYLHETDRTLAPDKKAELVVAIYEEMLEAGEAAAAGERRQRLKKMILKFAT
jgi:transcriptional regulator with XRE-family HTH domain